MNGQICHKRHIHASNENKTVCLDNNHLIAMRTPAAANGICAAVHIAQPNDSLKYQLRYTHRPKILRNKILHTTFSSNIMWPVKFDIGHFWPVESDLVGGSDRTRTQKAPKRTMLIAVFNLVFFFSYSLRVIPENKKRDKEQTGCEMLSILQLFCFVFKFLHFFHNRTS